MSCATIILIIIERYSSVLSNIRMCKDNYIGKRNGRTIMTEQKTAK